MLTAGVSDTELHVDDTGGETFDRRRGEHLGNRRLKQNYF